MELSSKPPQREALIPTCSKLCMFFTLILFAIPMILQISGLEVVGGDPDRFFRPLKSELVRQMFQGKIPLWSDLFGYGMPLAGQSEIGAFYLPHYIIYGLLGVGAGYRVSMVLHQIIGAIFIYQLARRLGAVSHGSLVASAIYLFGGFSTIQASKEWALLGMAWLPGAFLGVEIWFQLKSRLGLILASVSIASLALIGHFQMAQITSLGLLVWVLARTSTTPALLKRWALLIIAVVFSVGMALPQLLISWNYANQVNATTRSFATLSYYSYPLWNFVELIFPLWTRFLSGGPEGAYWTIHQTTQYEACQYFGSIGLILAIVGALRKDSRPFSAALTALALFSVMLSTMPQWSPDSYARILTIPGLGLFRCPSRYGILLHFAVSILAALGFGQKFHRSIALLLLFLFVISALILFYMKTNGFSIAGRVFPVTFPAFSVFGQGVCCFLVAISLVAFMHKSKKILFLTFLFTMMELMSLYYIGPTRWGWSLNLPHSSNMIDSMKLEKFPVAIAGPVDNIPVTAGFRTIAPYFGVNMPHANEFAKKIVEASNKADRQNQPNAFTDILAKLGTTHQVLTSKSQNSETFSNESLAQIILPDELRNRPLYLQSVVATSIYEAIPLATVAKSQPEVVENSDIAFERSILNSSSQGKILIDGESQKDWSYPDFTTIDDQAILELVDGQISVEHSKPVIILISRTFDLGWNAFDKARNKVVLRPVNGGLTGMFLNHPGNGERIKTSVQLTYWPRSLNFTIPLSVALWLVLFVQSVSSIRGHLFLLRKSFV